MRKGTGNAVNISELGVLKKIADFTAFHKLQEGRKKCPEGNERKKWKVGGETCNGAHERGTEGTSMILMIA